MSKLRNLGAATKQYVDSAVSTSAANFTRKDGTVAFTGDQSLGSHKLTNVTDPSSAQDAATKNYADTSLVGKAINPSMSTLVSGGVANTWGFAIAVDSSANIYVTGLTDGGLDGNTLTGYGDFFISKYNTSGTKLWTRQLGASGSTSQANGIALDPSGNVYVAGWTSGNLDGNTMVGLNNDFFISKYNTSGVKQWTRELGVSGTDSYAYGIAVDSSGNAYVTGYTGGGLDGNTPMGSRDFFITKYNTSGTKQWTKQFGASMAQTYSRSIAVDSSGNIYVTGDTDGSLAGNSLVGTKDFAISKYNASGVKQWTKQMGVSGVNTETYGITVDSGGNAFVTGLTAGALDGNTLKGTGDYFISKFNTSGEKQWTKQFGVSGAMTFGNSIAADTLGNVYITGYTGGGLDGNTLMGVGMSDFFVVKYGGN